MLVNCTTLILAFHSFSLSFIEDNRTDKISIKHKIRIYHSSTRLNEELAGVYLAIILLKRRLWVKEDEEGSSDASLLNLISMMGDS